MLNSRTALSVAGNCGVAHKGGKIEIGQSQMKKFSQQEIDTIEYWTRKIHDFTSLAGLRKFMFEDVFDRYVQNGTTLHNAEFHDTTNLLKRAGIYFHPDPKKSPEVELYPLFNELLKTDFNWNEALKRIDSQNRLSDELNESNLLTNKLVRLNVVLSLSLSAITLCVLGVQCQVSRETLSWQKSTTPQYTDSLLLSLLKRQQLQDSILIRCLEKSINTDSILIELQKASKPRPPKNPS